MIGDGFATPEERQVHLVTASHDLATARAHLLSCETAADIVTYVPPVLEQASRLINWPSVGELGALHDVYYRWTDVSPSAGYLTGFLAARDDVCHAAEQLYSAATGWTLPGGDALIGQQSAVLLGELETAARRSLELLPQYAPTAAETAAADQQADQHNELHLDVAAEQRRETGQPTGYLPTDAPGRIGHIVAAVDALRSALGDLENAHEPVEISYRVPAMLAAANRVGQGAQSAPSEALQSMIARWAELPSTNEPSPGLLAARHALVQLGWALAQAIESEATLWRQGFSTDSTPETDHALSLLIVEANEAWTRVTAP
jgi:hypothetical protein